MAEITQQAERLKARLEVPPSGEVHLLPATPATELVGSAFGVFADAASSGATPSIEHLDDVMCAMVRSLSESDRTRRIGCGHRIDSRHIVLTAIDFAEAVGRIPSISELCATTHLSERRLRQAFTDEYDMPPSRFFRAWALGEAHRRLASANAATQTVTRVATALGFDHLGRFSGHYSDIFDEHPSATLRAAN